MFWVPREIQTPSSHGATRSDVRDDPATPQTQALTHPKPSPPPLHPPATTHSPPQHPTKYAQSSLPADSAPIQTPSLPYRSPKVFQYREKAPQPPKDLHPPPDKAAPTPAPLATSVSYDPSILPAERDDFFWLRLPSSTSPHTFPKPSDTPTVASNPSSPQPTGNSCPTLSEFALSSPHPRQKKPPPHLASTPVLMAPPHSARNHSAQIPPSAPNTLQSLPLQNTHTHSNPKTDSVPTVPSHPPVPPSKTVFRSSLFAPSWR